LVGRKAHNCPARGLLLSASQFLVPRIGPKASPGKQTNWVQTVPGQTWFTILRLYGPLEPWFNMTWRPGEMERQP